MDINERRRRANIYFTRAKRRFKVNPKEQIFYVLALIVPTLVLFLMFYTELSKFITELISIPLRQVLPEGSVGIVSSEFIPWFGGVYYVSLPTSIPGFKEIWINIVITLTLLALSIYAAQRANKKTPLPIYFTFILIIHLISCLYFLFARDYFPYTGTQYAELYIKQQIVIWFSLILLIGFVLGVIGYGKMSTRILMFFVLAAYAFVFGVARYLAFTYLVTAGSALYMATFFFTLGPLYEFLYFVFFYSVFVNREIKYYGYGEGRDLWQWS